MSIKLTKAEIKLRVKKMINQMLHKPNKGQREVLVEALKQNAKVQSKQQKQASNV